MASPIFLYPSLSEDAINSGIFHAEEYRISYTDKDGSEKNLEYEGREEIVLVDGASKINPEMLSGRTDGGKIVNFIGSDELIGKYVKVKITKPKQWSLEGELV